MLRLDLPTAAEAELQLYDFNGRRVATVRSGREAAGRHIYAWDGSSDTGRPMASGVYFGRTELRLAGQRSVYRMRVLLVR